MERTLDPAPNVPVQDTAAGTRPSASGGVTSTISRTPAMRAGTAVISTLDG